MMSEKLLYCLTDRETAKYIHSPYITYSFVFHCDVLQMK